jgi:hypothetical protein
VAVACSNPASSDTDNETEETANLTAPLPFDIAGHSYVAHPGPWHWPAARAWCDREYGADLIVIDAPAEIDGLIVNLAEFDDDWWIGLSDIAVEGRYTWLDGSELVDGFWQDGQPGSGGSSRDCVEMQSASTLRWRDASCSELGGAVCELAD